MPTIEYSCDEIENLIKFHARCASSELRVDECIGEEKESHVVLEATWIHENKDREPSSDSNDFNRYTSKIKISFRNRY